MARSRYATTVSFTCAEDGCRDRVHWQSENREDYQRLYKRQQERPYKCTRHANPERVLSPTNRHTEQVLVAVRLPHLPEHLSWRPEGAERPGSGYTCGPGFNAHASDVPEGTRLVISARLELPQPDDDPDAGQRAALERDVMSREPT